MNYSKYKPLLFISASALVLAVLIYVVPPLDAGLFGLMLVVLCSVKWGLGGGIISAAWASGILLSLYFFSDIFISSVELITALVAFVGLGVGLGKIIDIIRLQEKKIRDRNEELQYEKQFASEVLDTQGALVTVLDKDGGIVRFNRACEETTGYTRAEVVGRRFQDIFLDEDGKEDVMSVFESLNSGDHRERFENHWLTKSGERRLISWANTVLHAPDGNISHIVATGVDVTEHRETERALRENEKNLSLTLQSIGDGVIVTDPDARIVRLNPVAEKLTGWTSDEAMGRPVDEVFQLVKERTGKPIANPVHKVIEKGEGSTLESDSTLIARDGTKRQVVDSAAPIFDGDDELTGVIMVFLDVTEQYRIQQALQESEKRYRTLFETMAEGCIVIGHDLECVYVNDVAVEQGQKTRGKLIGKKFNEICPGLSDEELLSAVEDSLKNRVVRRLEKLFTLPDGDKRWFQLSMHPVPEGVFMLSLDITDRKRTEDLIKENEKQFRHLVSNVPGVIFRADCDPERTIKYISDGIEELAGYPASDFFNNAVRAFHSIIDPEDRAAVSEAVRDKLPDKNHYTVTYRIKTASGEVKWVFESGQVVSDEDDDGGGYIDGFLIDITERKKTEDNLQSQLEFEKRIYDISTRFIETTTDRIEEGIQYALESIGGFFDVDRSYLILFADGKRDLKDIHEWCWEGIEPKIEGIRDIQSLLCFPVVIDGKLSGFLGIDAPGSGEGLSENQRSLMCVVAEVISNAMARHHAEEELKYLTYHDPLTDAFNRRFFEEETTRLDVKRQLPMSIVMGDVNGLKLFNDTFGHDKGDDLLRKAVDILKDSFRKEDIVARWGGDEFVALLPQTESRRVEEICARVRKACLETHDSQMPVSIALGYATKEGEDRDIQDVRREAEELMYRNKMAESRSAKSAVLQALKRTMRANGQETQEHVTRQQELAMAMGKEIGLSKAELDRLSLMVSLHDIGKAAIPGEILTKPGPLTEEEMEIMKTHPERGYRILASTDEFAQVADAILYHHEHWDGGGYPEGLKGEDIPVISRIAAIVDAYDVMVSHRPYSESMAREESVAELKKCAGTQFDPELVDVFVRVCEGGTQVLENTV